MAKAVGNLVKALFFLLFTLLVAALPLIFLSRTINKWVNVFDLMRNGLRLQAEIMSAESLEAYDNDGYTITYRFFIPGQAGGWYTGEQYIYDSLNVGSFVTATYLPENPNISRLGDASIDFPLIVETLIIGFLGAVACIPIIATLLRIGKRIVAVLNVFNHKPLPS